MSDICQGRDHKFSRRRLLYSGSLAAAYLAATKRGDAQVTSTPVAAKSTARACILVSLNGAPSQLDTFDPKDGPWNPGDLNLTQYNGMVLSKTYYPLLSASMGDLLSIRSAASWEAVHERGQFYGQTGHPANPAFVAESPHIGSVVGKERGAAGVLPPFLMLNAGSSYQGAKFLGGTYEPLRVAPTAAGLSTLEHNFYSTNSQARFIEKYQFLLELDAGLRTSPYSQEMAAHAEFYPAARRMMYDPAVAAVFRFTDDENARYGNNPFGRACLVARNAVRAKAGVSFINIWHGNWDTHQQMHDRAYQPNMYTLNNQLDSGLGNLMADLKESGDFASTMIVVGGEFGRTPGALNTQDGRDHYKDVMSVMMLGGGVRGGRAIGATDREASSIVDSGWSRNRPIYMEDIFATIYSALGINWTTSITDTPSGRKFEYIGSTSAGPHAPVDEVFG